MNSHLFICPNFQDIIYNCMTKCRQLVLSSLSSHHFYPGCEADYARTLYRSLIFEVTASHEFNNSHPFYLLIRGFVPKIFFELLKSKGLRHSASSKLIFEIMDMVTRDVTRPIWQHYTKALHQWEIDNHISAKIKTLRRKRYQSLRHLTVSRSSQLHRPRSRHSHVSSSTSHTSHSSPEVSIHFPAPINGAQQLPRHVYNRLPLDFWILCTSSYFRHGGNINLQFLNLHNVSTGS